MYAMQDNGHKITREMARDTQLGEWLRERLGDALNLGHVINSFTHGLHKHLVHGFAHMSHFVTYHSHT